MLPSTSSTLARFPSSRAQWSSTQRIFWTGSSRRDVTRTGRRLTWNAPRRHGPTGSPSARRRTWPRQAPASRWPWRTSRRWSSPGSTPLAGYGAGDRADRLLAHDLPRVHPVRRREASAAFYDAVLAPLGGVRVMEFDGAIGYGIPPLPTFWIGQQQTGEGFRETHIAFEAPDRDAVRAFFEAAQATGAEVLHEPRLWPEYHPTTTAPSCGIRTGTTWRRSATPPNDRSGFSRTARRSGSAPRRSPGRPTECRPRPRPPDPRDRPGSTWIR